MIKRYDIDPIHLCQCGQYSDKLELIEVEGGRYVDAEEALGRIASLEAAVKRLQTVLNKWT